MGKVRYDAALWCLEKFGIERVDILKPIEAKMENSNTKHVACFWFANQEDANWFALKWL